MSRFDKTCIVCKTKYKFCPTCAKYKGQPRWRISFCSEDCLNIYKTLSDYKAGIITALEAINILELLDTSRSDFYVGSFKEIYDELMAITNNINDV